jgi:hypothetical protein
MVQSCLQMGWRGRWYLAVANVSRALPEYG